MVAVVGSFTSQIVVVRTKWLAQAQLLFEALIHVLYINAYKYLFLYIYIYADNVERERETDRERQRETEIDRLIDRWKKSWVCADQLVLPTTIWDVKLPTTSTTRLPIT